LASLKLFFNSSEISEGGRRTCKGKANRKKELGRCKFDSSSTYLSDVMRGTDSGENEGERKDDEKRNRVRGVTHRLLLNSDRCRGDRHREICLVT